MLDDPRPHHYLFAHRELPSAAQRFGADLVASAREGRLSLSGPWRSVGQSLDPADRLDDAGLDSSYLVLDGHEVLLVTFPPPNGPTEAHFAAVVPDGDGIRYFVLEDALSPLDGRRYTVLGEWTADGTHVNYGAGPTPDPQTFLAAVARLIGAGSS